MTAGSSGLDLDAAALLEGLHRGEGEEHGASSLLEGHRVRAFATEEGGPGGHLLGVALAFEAPGGALAPAVDVERLEVLQFGGEPGAEHGADLLRPGAVALGGIDELSARAVGEFDLGGDAVGEWQPSGGRPDCLRADA